MKGITNFFARCFENFFIRHFDYILTERWWANDGRYLSAPKRVVDLAIDEAKDNGTEKQFLKLLKIIQNKLDHGCLRMGHLFWIVQVIKDNQEIHDEMDVPSFERNGNKG